ncbi:hypothetical protein BaRGS_00001210 [Batillaria attramentaria]|uniref:Angio-associated migratory cell protein n=1 Tax=Batillaria attramentaria TaxID=370345 RepID=A0ABD0M5Q1_9CAEN
MDPNNDDFDDVDELNPDDVIRVIDLPDNGEAEQDEMETDEEQEGAEGGDSDDVPVDEKAAVVFTGHRDKPHPEDEPPEVYAVHIDPSGSGLVVTGGRDDMAYVWNAATGQVLFKCAGHKNSVTCVAFSHDGLYVASADLDGLVKVWRCESKAAVWFFESGSDITWLQWHHAAHVLVAGTQDGEVWMWKIPSGDCKTFQSHGAPSQCGRIMPDGKSACVGYGDGVVKLWDLKAGKPQHTWQHSVMPDEASMQEREDSEPDEGGEMRAEASGGGEEGATSPVAILCVDCSADNSLIMSGCADATVKIFNTSSGKLVSAFNCAVNRDKDNSVEAVGFCPSAPYAATATNSGAVEIWDLPTSVEGVCKVRWSSSSAPLLYTACLDGIMRLWDTRSGSSKAVWTGHAKHRGILDFDVARDESCLVSASEDGTARVFDLRSVGS